MNIQKPTRELSIEESLKWTFDLYTNNFPTLFLPSFLASIITGSLGALLTTYAIDTASLLNDLLTGDTELVLATLGMLLATLVVTSLISWVLGTLASGTCTKCASDIIEKGSASLDEAFSFTARKLLKLLAASFLTGAIILIGVIMLVVPGIIFTLMFALVTPVIINENVGILDSMSRSRRLVDRRWLMTFVLVLIVGMISIFVSVIALFLTAPLGVVGSLINSIITSFAAPVYTIAITVYYYSMRGKEEQQRFTLPPPPF